MHNHARRLVQHNQVVVFIDDIKRNILRYDVTFLRLFYGNRDLRPFGHPRARVRHDDAVHLHRTIRNQLAQTRA
jgi:hypothetical protein